MRGRTVAERMRTSVEEMKTNLPHNSQPVKITASFGLASLHLGDEETLDSLIKRVDEAVYRAKHEGKNRVCVSDDLKSDGVEE